MGTYRERIMLTDLAGQIERITFSNDENGFTIAKVKVSGQTDLVTVVGSLMAPVPGEVLEMKGEWTQHPKFGEQFKVATYKSVVPASVFGIRKYLGSGLIKGLGPVMAGQHRQKIQQQNPGYHREQYRQAGRGRRHRQKTHCHDKGRLGRAA